MRAMRPSKRVETELLSSAVYSIGIAICIAAASLPHLNISHEGTVYSFVLFAAYSGTGNTLLGEAAHQASSKVAFIQYSVMVHILLCMFAWILTDFYVRTTTVPKWMRHLLSLMAFGCIVIAAFFILIADDFSTPGVSATRKDTSSIASTVSFQQAYRTQGTRGTGAHLFPLLPVVTCILGFVKHE